LEEIMAVELTGIEDTDNCKRQTHQTLGLGSDRSGFAEPRVPSSTRNSTGSSSVPPPLPSSFIALKTTMETSFAITGKGYVIVAADTTAARSIVKMKVDEDKIKTLSPHLLMAYSGEPGTRSYPLDSLIF
jgi:hypothetical protein